VTHPIVTVKHNSQATKIQDLRNITYKCIFDAQSSHICDLKIHQIRPNLEKTITNKIIKYINKNYPNSEARKRLSTGSTNNTGYPDITGSINGIRIEIEVKQPGCEPSKLQYSRLRKLKKLNIIAFWADSLESAISQLDQQLCNWRLDDNINLAA